MTASDAPQPPGGPLRQDAPEGDFATDVESQDLPTGGSDGSEADDTERKEPDVEGEPEQSGGAAALQEENAETSMDQPSS